MAGWAYRNMIPSGDDGEEFGEEDVWLCGFEREDSSSSYSSAWRSSCAPRIIHKASNQMRGLEHDVKVGGGQSSAPVKIPDWSKSYGKGLGVGSRNGSWVDDGESEMGYDDDDDDDDGMVVPPHEWLSRKHARSQVSSFSMCEGIGRTLKGRDLSKLRNAILTKTGFLE